MNRAMMLLLSSGVLLASTLATVNAAEHVAGTSLSTLSEMVLSQPVTGWSAKRQILGRDVYNDKSEKIGEIKDIIISQDRSVTYAIIGAGGFLGLGEHDVAISVDYIHRVTGKLVIGGATKETLKKMPAFKYAETR